jgi:hypothetical protein
MQKLIDRVIRPACVSLLLGMVAPPIAAADRSTDGLTVTSMPRSPSGRIAPNNDPFALVSSTSLLRYLGALTEIEPHSGWRVCGSAGERTAFAYVERRLGLMSFLERLGLEVQRQSLRTIAGVEMHESRLEFDIGGSMVEVPADSIAGHPYDLELTRLADSDGGLTDLDQNPVVAEGQVRLLETVDQISALGAGDLVGQIAILKFELIDLALIGGSEAFDRVSRIFDADPAGIVTVTRDSLEVGESHGSFALDTSILTYLQASPPIPLLVARIEDMSDVAIDDWQGLDTVTAARLTWDTDIVSPGDSGNLVARIPGQDPSQAVILSAHLDSPNSPGALDNGSGSASLLEVARVLDRTRTTPPVDVVLVWFGCHEKGMFGSPHFAATHQDLLDRTLGMIELDAMGRPLNGLADPVNLESWSYSRLGDDSLPFPEFLQSEVEQRGIHATTWDFHYLLSDITGFVPYNVPNAELDNLDFEAIEQIGSAHYTAHWHSPYDTIEHARAESEQFERLTRAMLAAALDTGEVRPDLRVTPPPDGRAVFVASHTEAVHMSPMLMTDLGTILAWEGLDLDLVPYGETLTANHLENAAMVVILPVHDYPSTLADVGSYDEAWSEGEVSVLVDYVEDGGLLVLTNSASRLGPFGRAREVNEDAGDLNLVAAEFGVRYETVIAAETADVVSVHPLVDGVDDLTMIDGNGVSLSVDGSYDALARAGNDLAAARLDVGESGGEVIALADIGLLVSHRSEPTNFRFWQNLVDYARDRRQLQRSAAATSGSDQRRRPAAVGERNMITSGSFRDGE